MTMGKIQKKLDVQSMQIQINYYLEFSMSFKMESDRYNVSDILSLTQMSSDSIFNSYFYGPSDPLYCAVWEMGMFAYFISQFEMSFYLCILEKPQHTRPFHNYCSFKIL